MLSLCSTAHGQSLTTGAVQGVISDSETGIALPGVNVTIGNQTAVTEYNGGFKITELIPGTYDVTFEFGTTQKVHTGIVVGANNTTSLYEKLDIGEHVQVHGTPPPINIIDQSKITRITDKDIASLPTGPTFEGALRGVPGAQNDGVGIAMSGSSALENRYLVDGIDITGLTFGDVGTPLLNAFIHEIVAVSGGYNAEYGRATGGVVNIVTKSGTDTLSGSVFGVVTPGFLTMARVSTPRNASSIDLRSENAYTGNFGFELGGPIVPKRAWFYVGLAPQVSRTDYIRTTKRQSDCRKLLDSGKLSTCSPMYADTQPDIDPKTGFYLTDTLDTEVRSATDRSAQAIGKVNVAVTPDDQLQLSLIGVPSSGRTPALIGLPSTGTRSSGLTTDTMARWTSKLGGGSTELEALAAWHRSTSDTGSIDPSYDDVPLQQIYGVKLTKMAALGGETAKTGAGCNIDDPNNPYPGITLCPTNLIAYGVGGPGPISRDKEERRAARIGVLHRVKAIGTHELKAGLDFEDNLKTKARVYSGGALITNYGSTIYANRYAELEPPGVTDPRYDRTCTTPDPSGGSGSTSATKSFACRYLGGVDDPTTRVRGKTLNWGTYLQDSWHPLQNLTFNAGVRYEEQRLYYASNLRNTVDPLTGDRYGDTALRLRGNWSPRLGAIWDPTREGRAKLYGAWGRYYEGIPMDINDRSFGGEVFMRQTFAASSCGPVDPQLGVVDGNRCLTSAKPTSEQLIGSSGVLIASGIKAQYMDETLLGGELALPSSFVFGAVLQSRRLGRVIEDVSTDGANTYIIANPGEWSEADERELLGRIATTTDKVQKARLENQLQLFRGIRTFDKPVRDYQALELTLSRRYAEGLVLSASYTYSRAAGNYPGLVSYDNGQIDPNISSQYDLIELLANRKGKLPQDRPHYVKVDAYRDFQIGRDGTITVGGRLRLLSGIPRNALGAHYLYGPDESFLLPRGELGRTSFDHGLDVHLGYKQKLSHGTAAELYVDVFNVYDRQGEFRVDDTYAPPVSLAGVQQSANPISGGTYEDLIFAKALDSAGKETADPLGRNPNFGRTTARYAPASAQVGFRVTF